MQVDVVFRFIGSFTVPQTDVIPTGEAKCIRRKGTLLIADRATA